MSGEIPVLEDNNHKGATRGEAIFGDKQAGLVADTAPEAAAIVEKYQAAQETSEAAGHAAALLSLHQEAAQNDWPQDRVDAAQADLNRRHNITVK
jgi:hypothetical protein